MSSEERNKLNLSVAITPLNAPENFRQWKDDFEDYLYGMEAIHLIKFDFQDPLILEDN